MRVVAGAHRGAHLTAPKGPATRPTSDRVREAVFNVLAHGIGGCDLQGARVLDLFAGSGALGLEALSRGAAYALFIDDAAAARGAMRTNVEALGLTGVTKIWRRDATRPGPAGTLSPFDLVFADPPYGKGLGEKALAEALKHGWLKPDALAVLEERSGVEIAVPDGFDLIETRTYGDTAVMFLRVK